MGMSATAGVTPQFHSPDHIRIGVVSFPYGIVVVVWGKLELGPHLEFSAVNLPEVGPNP